jgi:hypothetical protein
MTHGRVITTFALIALLAAPPFAAAQSRNRGGDRRGGGAGRAVPRGSGSRSAGPRTAGPGGGVRGVPPRAVARPYAYRGGYRGPVGRGYRGAVGRGYYSGYPRYYGSRFYYGYPLYGYPAYGYWAFGSPGYGYGYPAYPGFGYPAYGNGVGIGIRAYGGVRIDLPQRDAEVYVDGYYIGIVDDFDGPFQQAHLEPGPHRIEVRAEGFEAITFDANVLPNRTTTYRAGMQRLRP